MELGRGVRRSKCIYVQGWQNRAIGPLLGMTEARVVLKAKGRRDGGYKCQIISRKDKAVKVARIDAHIMGEVIKMTETWVVLSPK